MKQTPFAIVGAAGKVGYSTALKLREAGHRVRAILRDESKAGRLNDIGCEVAFADLQNPAALAKAMTQVDTVQIILPPAPQAPDAPAEMRRSIESLAEALEQSQPQRVLAISDYGAHVREDIGMPTVFRIFEERLRRLEMPKVFLRSAEQMEGWGRLVPAALAMGVLPSLHHPVGKAFPTVSAQDVGLMAADLLLNPDDTVSERIVHAEGPRRYSATDVAEAFSYLFGRTITATALPRSQWQSSLERIMGASTAQLLVEFFDAGNQGGLVDIEPNKSEVWHGLTELLEALRPLVSVPLG